MTIETKQSERLADDLDELCDWLIDLNFVEGARVRWDELRSTVGSTGMFDPLWLTRASVHLCCFDPRTQRWIIHPGDDEPRYVNAPGPDESYSQVVVAVHLTVPRHEAALQAIYDRCIESTRSSPAIRNATPRTGLAEAAARATALDSVRTAFGDSDAFDLEISWTTPPHSFELSDWLGRAGLVVEGDDMWFRTKEGRNRFRARWNGQSACWGDGDLVFEINLPHLTEPVETLARMVEIARSLGLACGGAVSTHDGQPPTETLKGAICKIADLRAAGIEPGSERALRLFPMR